MCFSCGIPFTSVLSKVPIQMMAVSCSQFGRESGAARTALHTTVQRRGNRWLFTVKEKSPFDIRDLIIANDKRDVDER